MKVQASKASNSPLVRLEAYDESICGVCPFSPIVDLIVSTASPTVVRQLCPSWSQRRHLTTVIDWTGQKAGPRCVHLYVNSSLLHARETFFNRSPRRKEKGGGSRDDSIDPNYFFDGNNYRLPFYPMSVRANHHDHTFSAGLIARKFPRRVVTENGERSLHSNEGLSVDLLATIPRASHLEFPTSASANSPVPRGGHFGAKKGTSRSHSPVVRHNLCLRSKLVMWLHRNFSIHRRARCFRNL